MSDENVSESTNSLTWFITLVVLLIIIFIIIAAIFMGVIKRNKNSQSHIELELREARGKQNYYTDTPHHYDAEHTDLYENGYENMM